MDEVYIKKSDLLEKVVTEEMGDFVEREIVHLCDINKCETYTKDDLEKYKGAYDYIYNGVMSKIEECKNEAEILLTDLKAGEKGVGLSRKCFEVRVKKELLQEILYIVDEALKDERKGV